MKPEEVADAVIEGLTEYYAILRKPAFVAELRNHLIGEYQDTGNNQSDYERLRDKAEVYIGRHKNEE